MGWLGLTLHCRVGLGLFHLWDSGRKDSDYPGHAFLMVGAEA